MFGHIADVVKIKFLHFVLEVQFVSLFVFCVLPVVSGHIAVEFYKPAKGQ